MEILASLPAYGALVEQLQQWGGESPDDEQWLALEEFELEVQEMCQALHAQCLDFLYDEELRHLIDPILVAYQLTYAAIDAIREAWSEGEPWEEHWEKARDNLAQALGGYPELAGWYERQPRLSPSPYVHELLRVGRACLAELLPWEAFSLRLEHYLQVLEQFCQRYHEEEVQLQTWGLNPGQRAQLEERVEGLWAVLEQLEPLQPETLEKNLQQLAQLTEQLFAWQHGVQLDFEQPLRGDFCCPRCAHSNPRTQRMCARCGARLPQTYEDNASTLDLHSEGSQPGLPERIAELIEAIEGLQRGQLEPQSCWELVQSARARAQRVGQQLGQLKPTDDPLLQQAQELLHQSQAEFTRVLERLSQALESDDRAALPALCDELTRCGLAPQELGQLSQQLQEQQADSEGEPVA